MLFWEAEKAAIAQIEGIAASNELASTHEAETIDLAPLYAARDKAQARYDGAVKEFEKQVQEYERKWLAVYEYYIASWTTSLLPLRLAAPSVQVFTSGTATLDLRRFVVMKADKT